MKIVALYKYPPKQFSLELCEMECRIIKSGHSPKKNFTVPTPKASSNSKLNFTSHINQSEQELKYKHITPDAGL